MAYAAAGHDVRAYHEAGVRVSDGLPTSPSVDEFLANHAHDDAMVRVGKLAIASCILNAERKSKFFHFSTPVQQYAALVQNPEPVDETSSPAETVRALADTWLFRLFRQLTPEYSKDHVRDIFERFTFIVFNYDRCIEQFLYYALRSHYTLSSEEAGEIVNRTQIIHPYGWVGAPTQGSRAARPETVAFGQQLAYVDLNSLADGIKTLADLDGRDTLRSLIQARLEESERVVFLGFGFHKQNTDLLPRRHVDNQFDLYATVYGEPDPRVNVYKSRLSYAGLMFGTNTFVWKTCSQFIEDYGLV